jgi:hypothetical protein
MAEAIELRHGIAAALERLPPTGVEWWLTLEYVGIIALREQFRLTAATLGWRATAMLAADERAEEVDTIVRRLVMSTSGELQRSELLLSHR